MRKLALEPLFFPWKHYERTLCPDEFLRMHFKLADDLTLRPREWSILRYLWLQFPNGHLFELFYKCISLCLLNEKYVNWRTWRTLYRCTYRWSLYIFIIFLDSTKLKTVCIKITTAFKRRVSIILWSFSS